MKKKKVMVFGVFDLMHPGHVDFLKQAKKIGNFLIVSIARDVNVIKVKGIRPFHNEKERADNVGKVPYVDKIVFGGLKDAWPHIVKEKPDIIALGYDQKTYVMKHETRNTKQDKLFKAELEEHGLKKTEVVRLKPFWPEIYKTKLLRKKS